MTDGDAFRRSVRRLRRQDSLYATAWALLFLVAVVGVAYALAWVDALP